MKFESPVLPRRPAELDVAEEHHGVRTPVLDGVGEDVGVHERAPGLPGADLPELAPGVAQAEGRLSGVDAHPEQLELEDRLELAELRGRDSPSPRGGSGARRRSSGRPRRTRSRRPAAWSAAPRRTSSGRSGPTGSPCRASPRRRCPSGARARPGRSGPAPWQPASGSARLRPHRVLDPARARAGVASASDATISQPAPRPGCWCSSFSSQLPPCPRVDSGGAGSRPPCVRCDQFPLAFSHARTRRRASSKRRS